MAEVIQCAKTIILIKRLQLSQVYKRRARFAHPLLQLIVVVVLFVQFRHPVPTSSNFALVWHRHYSHQAIQNSLLDSHPRPFQFLQAAFMNFIAIVRVQQRPFTKYPENMIRITANTTLHWEKSGTSLGTENVQEMWTLNFLKCLGTYSVFSSGDMPLNFLL